MVEILFSHKAVKGCKTAFNGIVNILNCDQQGIVLYNIQINFISAFSLSALNLKAKVEALRVMVSNVQLTHIITLSQTVNSVIVRMYRL